MSGGFLEGKFTGPQVRIIFAPKNWISDITPPSHLYSYFFLACFDWSFTVAFSAPLSFRLLFARSSMTNYSTAFVRLKIGEAEPTTWDAVPGAVNVSAFKENILAKLPCSLWATVTLPS